MPYDLSEVFFICTGNVKYQIPRALADRMDIIDLPGYMLEEKVSIGLRHLLPNVLAEHGLAPEQLRIPPSVMQHIVTGYTREAGVRNLERQLATICRKAARRIIEKPDTRLRLTTHALEHYLGTPRYSESPMNQKMQVGTAMGLAVTENGGMLLPVEVVTMVGKGDLIVTGQLGDVMRESAVAALSYIRSRADTLQIDPSFQETTDLHIHLPENALPKDGPSAGITIATTLISALTGRPVRGDVAMTGEITLRGRVLAVGGLKEKVLAAHHAHIYHLVVPAENKKDLAEIPAKIRQQIRFTLVENMDQVIEATLLDGSSLAEGADLSLPAPQAGLQMLPEPRPLRGDERLIEPSALNRNSPRGEVPADSLPEEETNEHKPASLIIPPPDRIAGDSYPQVQAQDSEQSGSKGC
jgi:ATP-dependent Lon protease